MSYQDRIYLQHGKRNYRHSKIHHVIYVYLLNQVRLGRLWEMFYNNQQNRNPNTIPTNCHSYHKAPNHLSAFSRLDANEAPNSYYTSQDHLMTNYLNTPLFFQLRKRIPILLLLVIAIHLPTYPIQHFRQKIYMQVLGYQSQIIYCKIELHQSNLYYLREGYNPLQCLDLLPLLAFIHEQRTMNRPEGLLRGVYN